MKPRSETHSASHRKRRRKPKLSSDFAQSIVLINGVIITLIAFMSASYVVQSLTHTENKKTIESTGKALVNRVADVENTVRLVTSIINLSESTDRSAVIAQVRRNVPYLSDFDQLIWLYERSPGSWKYMTITGDSEIPDHVYRMQIDRDMITELIKADVFKSDALSIHTDFSGMEYVQESDTPSVMARSFSFVKMIDASKSSQGVVLGVTRPSLLFGEKIENLKGQVSTFTIKDVASGLRLFHLDVEHEQAQSEALQQKYKFVIGDKEWQVDLAFHKNTNTILLETIPYSLLIFGFVLTLLGTLFVRSNYRQSRKLSSINQMLEKNNRDLKLQVNERERLNKMLHDTERNNRAIMDAVSDILFEIDKDGQVQFLSAAWETVTGFEIERSLGNSLFSMFNVQDQEKHKQEFSRLVRGQKTSYRAFTKLRVSSGKFRSVELAMSIIRQDQDSNTVWRIVGTLTDVEERRRAERALAEAEKKYRAIVENVANGIYQLTPEGMYISVNPAMARILGYDRPEDILRHIKNANTEVYVDYGVRQKFMQDIVKLEQMSSYDVQVQTRSGEAIWVRENIRLVKDEAGNALYFEGTMEDVTEQKTADAYLMRAKIESDMASRAKTEFIKNMSHELRTPLNAIIGFSDIIQNEVMGKVEQGIYVEYARDIHTSGKGLLKIINEILEISKIEAGDRELKEAEFSCGDILDACFDLYESRAKAKKIHVHNDTDAKTLPYLIGEQLAVKQVFGNIYSNAIKYTENGGRITVFSNYDTNGAFRLSITDTGIGMSDEEIDTALASFGQVDGQSLARSGSGVGLGLSLSKVMMELHAGRIEIVSQKGIGTTVTLIFPPERVIMRDTVTA